MNKKADFDEWMSGRYWLGDKAPAEGFYGRYKEHQIEFMRTFFDAGAEGNPVIFPDKLMTSNDIYLAKWSHWCGTYFTSRVNEKSE